MSGSKTLIELIDEYMAMDLDDPGLTIPRMNLRRNIDDYGMGQLQAEVARLRGALEHVRDNVAPDKEGIFYSPTPYLTELTFDICEAALSTPADGMED